MRVTRIIGAAMFLVCLCGCLKRTETVKIHKDGSVLLTVEIAGDPNDVNEGDPLFVSNGAWLVSRELIEKDEDSELKIRATRRISAGEDIPAQYAEAGDLNADVGLEFPSKLVIEEREDGVYYHFSRVYRGRPRAEMEFLHRRHLESDEIKALSGKDANELSQIEQQHLVEAFIRFERDKDAALSMKAAVGLALSQDQVLSIRDAVLDAYGSLDRDRIVALMLNEQHESIEAEASRMVAAVEKAIRRNLTRADIALTTIDEFFRRLDTQKRRLQVSDDLADESWSVEVEMPGSIVRHNGESYAGNRVKWEFEGDALSDRDVEIRVTSRIPG